MGEYVYKYIVRTDANINDKYYYLLKNTSHDFNSTQSFKSQYEYTKCERKYKMFNVLHKRRKRYIFENICVYGYILSTIVAYLFPIFWFFYVWIYLNVIREADVMIDLNTVNAQYIFVWIICSLYCCFACFWMAIVTKNTCNR